MFAEEASPLLPAEGGGVAAGVNLDDDASGSGCSPKISIIDGLDFRMSMEIIIIIICIYL